MRGDVSGDTDLTKHVDLSFLPLCRPPSKKKKEKLAAPQGVPRRSPTLVLTGPYAA